ncbi:unnamed protein product, partial [Heterotrigona itama]
LACTQFVPPLLPLSFPKSHPLCTTSLLARIPFAVNKSTKRDSKTTCSYIITEQRIIV